jgi:ATP-dependent DNA helicase RecG
VHRKELSPLQIIDLGSEKGSEKSSEKILGMLKINPDLTTRDLADALSITPRAVEKQIFRLRQANRIRRIGPDKGGYWEVIAGCGSKFCGR